jgi:UDP-glucose 4-epimerase
MLGVTGASGFIGAELVRLARELGHEVRSFSRSDAGAEPLDLTAPDLDPALFAGCDTIIHLAARLPSGASHLAEARDCWEVNALGTLRLLEALEAAGVRRLIQATAANAYAPWCEYPDERSPLYPLSRSYYLGSKVIQELYAHSFGASCAVEVTSVRISSPYGSSPRSAVGRIAARLLGGEPVQLQDGGAFGADFILVSDVAHALLLLERLGTDGVWNVATGQRTTMREIAEALAELAGADPSLIRLEDSGSSPFQGFPPIDIAKIRALGFAPTPVKAGLRTVLEELALGPSTASSPPA